MIYLFYGTDKIKVRLIANKTIEVAKKKHTNAEFFKLNSDNFSLGKLEELIIGQGLFYSACIVLMDNLMGNKEINESLSKKISAIKESPNFFVFIEEKLNKKELEILTKNAQKSEEISLPKKKLTKKEVLVAEGEKIDFFEFANALGQRDKKLLWTLYQEALHEDVASEEVHAIFFWQTKAMCSALQAPNATEAGLNPFVYGKAKICAKKYGEDRLKQMSSQLFEMYHEAHRGQVDFAVALERFILAL